MMTINELLSESIELARLELLVLALPQVETFRSAIGERRERQALLVRWYDRQGKWGIGECSCRPDPYFNGEFLEGALSLIRNFIFPALPERGQLRQVVQALNRIRGWPFTTAAVVEAALDWRRRQGKPDSLDHWPGPRSQRIPVGISLGLFPDADSAVTRVGEALAAGYHRIKLKVTPEMSLEPLQTIREVFPEAHLGFDANGSCSERDFPFLKELMKLHPVMLEQPFPPRRLVLCREFKREFPQLRLCLDESITDPGDLITAHQLQALDELNLKPGRVGGQFAAVQMMEYCREVGIPLWVGGMFETGVGRLANLRVAARIPEAAAHDLSPSDRYFREDILTHPIRMDKDGCVHLKSETPPAINESAIERYLRQRIILEKTG